MRWYSRQKKWGDLRIVRDFALWPIRCGDELVWLESFWSVEIWDCGSAKRWEHYRSCRSREEAVAESAKLERARAQLEEWSTKGYNVDITRDDITTEGAAHGAVEDDCPQDVGAVDPR